MFDLDLDSYVGRTESLSKTGLDPKNTAAPGTPGEFSHSIHEGERLTETPDEHEMKEPKTPIDGEPQDITKTTPTEGQIPEVINDQVKENAENDHSADKTPVTCNYPMGPIKCQTPEGMPELIISDPSDEYDFSEFQLKVVRTYDDDTVEESDKMVLGWRGSVKRYVNVFNAEGVRVNGFKQDIYDKDGNIIKKPNIYVKYHTATEKIITPIFSATANENVTEAELNYSLV